MPEDELVKFVKVNFFQLAKRDSNPRAQDIKRLILKSSFDIEDR